MSHLIHNKDEAKAHQYNHRKSCTSISRPHMVGKKFTFKITYLQVGALKTKCPILNKLNVVVWLEHLLMAKPTAETHKQPP